MAYKATTVEELLQIMRRVQGEKTNTAFAKELGISKQYLTDIYNGRKEPGDSVSTALGFQRSTAYFRFFDRRQREKKK